jgi:acyl carrier protein
MDSERKGGASMTIDEILDPILNAGRMLRLEDSVKTLSSWDSLRQLDVILAIGDVLGRDLTAAEIESLNSIASIVRFLGSMGLEVEVDATGIDADRSSHSN